MGWRTAIGRNGVASVAAEAGLGTRIQVGYTHYDLFGRGVRASANYRSRPASGTTFDRTAISELDVGIPLKGNHSLNIVAVNTTNRGSYLSFFYTEDATSIETSWLFNTLNDPVFPTSGRFVRSGVEFEQRRSESSGIVHFKDQAENISAVLTGDQYWLLSETSSLSGTFEIGTKQESFGDRWRAAIGTQYAKFLWRDVQRPHWRELRWETSLEVAHNIFSFSGDPGSSGISDSRTNSAGLSTGLKFRSKSSVLRLALTYQEVDRSR